MQLPAISMLTVIPETVAFKNSAREGVCSGGIFLEIKTIVTHIKFTDINGTHRQAYDYDVDCGPNNKCVKS